ncbi:MAG: NAD(+) synthase [Zavarzinella sp.]
MVENDRFGMVRVAAAVPQLALANPGKNAVIAKNLMVRAQSLDVDVLVFPELSLTGYTCNELFFQKELQDAARNALQQLIHDSEKHFAGILIVGLPLSINQVLYNCAAIISQGQLLGLQPKTYLPTYKEFYDRRFFAPAFAALVDFVEFDGDPIPFGTDLLFTAANVPDCTLGIEICEDLWTPIPISSQMCLAGATIIANLSASNETIGKVTYRRDLVVQQSARCMSGYIYAGAGVGESSTDLVFGGHALIAENGTLLAESERFSRTDQLLVQDIDLDRLRVNRQTTSTFVDGGMVNDLPNYRTIGFELPEKKTSTRTLRSIDPHPFIPKASIELNQRCEEIFHIQVAGLGRRLHAAKPEKITIGVSGGLDSTLALLVLWKTLKDCEIPAERVRAYTMPGFGTTPRTLQNARQLGQHLQISMDEVDIRQLCFDEWVLLKHAPFGINLDNFTLDQLSDQLLHLPPEKKADLVFENVQARARTSILMNSGFVIGTGDLSELALGWCTYNADHMSMYNPNVSIPKTLVKFLVRWIADHEFSGPTRETLLDIVATEISPELLPISADGKVQSTEATIGKYELHDFFLYFFLRFGMHPRKIVWLAEQARFDHPYTGSQIREQLQLFLRRFFQNQYKRSCIPDGPKVGSVSLSPRGDWRMPSDAQVNAWIESLNH